MKETVERLIGHQGASIIAVIFESELRSAPVFHQYEHVVGVSRVQPFFNIPAQGSSFFLAEKPDLVNLVKSTENRTLGIPKRGSVCILFEHFKVVPYIDSPLTKGFEFILTPQNARDKSIGVDALLPARNRADKQQDNEEDRQVLFHLRGPLGQKTAHGC